MIRELLPLFPKDASMVFLGIALTGAAFGLVLWLAGSRMSRSLLTLAAVTGGALAGLKLPQWLGWNVDVWGPTIAAALVMGLLGYLLHRLWIALGLAIIATAWACAGTWVLFGQGQPWASPAIGPDLSIQQVAQTIWAQLPADMQFRLPLAAGGAAFAGLVIGLFWNRLGLALFYSLVGVSLVVGMGLWALEVGKPEWLAFIPRQTSTQGAAILAMFVAGAALQWIIAPRSSKSAPESQRKPMVSDAL